MIAGFTLGVIAGGLLGVGGLLMVIVAQWLLLWLFFVVCNFGVLGFDGWLFECFCLGI